MRDKGGDLLKPLKVGIIGLGSWGESHLQAYRTLPNVEVAAVSDIRTERLDEIAGKYGIAKAYPDYEQLLQEDLDLVSIVTFEREHLQPVLAALSAGKHVVVEKPVTTDPEEAGQMLEAARKSGRHLLPGHLLRFDTRYAEIYESLKPGGRVGRPVSLYSKRSRAKGPFATYQRTHTVYELTVHDIDLAIWYASSRVAGVRAYGRFAMKGQVPDILWACLEFENGMIAVLESNWMTPDRAGIGLNDAIEVIGERGIAPFETSHSGVQYMSDRDGRYTPDLDVHYTIEGFKAGGCLQEELAYVCRTIADGGTPDRLSFADAVHGIEVAAAIERSAAEGREIKL